MSRHIYGGENLLHEDEAMRLETTPESTGILLSEENI
jgi:hypothetical protein